MPLRFPVFVRYNRTLIVRRNHFRSSTADQCSSYMEKEHARTKCVNNMKRFIFVCMKACVYYVASVEVRSCHTQIAAMRSELCYVKHDLREK